MRALIIAVVAIIMVNFSGQQAEAESYGRCPAGTYYSIAAEECKLKVAMSIAAQDQVALTGRQWGPPNAVNCAAASAEMDFMAKACRGFDARKGAYDALLGRVVDGKLLEDCALCCRNLREGMARWIQCHAIGEAPAPDFSSARRSAEAMNCGFTYYDG